MMKIIFSPSKEMRKVEVLFNKKNQSIDESFKLKRKELLQLLKKKNNEEISNIMKIKGKLLEETIENYRKYDVLEELYAISLYNGVAYKELNLEEYSDTSLNYIRDNLFLLSAFYGIALPFEKIKPYRLDMTMKIMEESLYNFWKKEVNFYIKNSLKAEEVLLNLASSEFSKIIDKNIPMITLDFKENHKGNLKSISNDSKRARGKYLDYLIRNQISNIEDIKKVSIDKYIFDENISDEKNFIFVRESKVEV